MLEHDITVRRWCFRVLILAQTVLWKLSHPPPPVSLLLPTATTNKKLTHALTHAFTTAARKQLVILNKYYTFLLHYRAKTTCHQSPLPTLF